MCEGTYRRNVSLRHCKTLCHRNRKGDRKLVSRSTKVFGDQGDYSFRSRIFPCRHFSKEMLSSMGGFEMRRAANFLRYFYHCTRVSAAERMEEKIALGLVKPSERVQIMPDASAFRDNVGNN